MAPNRLEQLLEKYWEGELSDQQEQEFKALLAHHKSELSGELLQMAEWFEAHDKGSQILTLDDDFDQQVMDKIHQSTQQNDSWSWMKIAASIIVIMGLAFTVWWFPQQNNAKIAEAEKTEKAYEEAKATLELMASMMNHGKQHLESLKMINTAQEKVKNTFQPERKSKTEQNQVDS